MNLSARRDGKGSAFKGRENFVRRATEIFNDGLMNCRIVFCRHLIGDLQEFQAIVRRQQVKTKSQSLTELDEGEIQFFKHCAKGARRFLRARPKGQCRRQLVPRQQKHQLEQARYRSEEIGHLLHRVLSRASGGYANLGADHRRRNPRFRWMCVQADCGLFT